MPLDPIAIDHGGVAGGELARDAEIRLCVNDAAGLHYPHRDSANIELADPRPMALAFGERATQFREG